MYLYNIILKMTAENLKLDFLFSFFNLIVLVRKFEINFSVFKNDLKNRNRIFYFEK
jgi:hypothetical protein